MQGKDCPKAKSKLRLPVLRKKPMPQLTRAVVIVVVLELLENLVSSLVLLCDRQEFCLAVVV